MMMSDTSVTTKMITEMRISNIEILSSLDRSNLDDAKIKVAKREADIYAKEHIRISEFDEINQINEVAHSPERSIHRAKQNSTSSEEASQDGKKCFSGSDSDGAEDDESNYDYMDAKLQESHDELIDRINEVQIFISLGDAQRHFACNSV